MMKPTLSKQTFWDKLWNLPASTPRVVVHDSAHFSKKKIVRVK